MYTFITEVETALSCIHLLRKWKLETITNGSLWLRMAAGQSPSVRA